MSNYSEIIHAIPTKKTVEHWNTTIQQNAYKNKSWFDSLTELQKKNLVELIAPIAMDDGLRFAIREGGRTVGAGVVASISA